MNIWLRILTLAGISLLVVNLGCSSGSNDSDPGTTPPVTTADDGDDGHNHADDGDDAHAHDDEGEHDHGHDEVPLGSTKIGDLTVECLQGHGETAPGKEMHLVVKLPYNDNGATTVRAWIGTVNRFASLVAKGDYAASHDDYDIHTMAPDPLPENAKWWIELEKPDGSKQMGSIAFR